MKENIRKTWLSWFWVPDVLRTGRILPQLHSVSLRSMELCSCCKRQQTSPAVQGASRQQSWICHNSMCIQLFLKSEADLDTLRIWPTAFNLRHLGSRMQDGNKSPPSHWLGWHITPHPEAPGVQDHPLVTCTPCLWKKGVCSGAAWSHTPTMRTGSVQSDQKQTNLEETVVLLKTHPVPGDPAFAVCLPSSSCFL